MILTVGGLPGSGTTTLSRKLSEQFSFTHIYAGKIFREMAQEKRISLEELSRKAETDETIDLKVDQRQIDLAVDSTVVEGRMTAYLVDADLKIWLVAPLDVRAQRVSSRENISYEESLEKIIKREKSEKKRYIKYYTINIEDLSVYDLVINTRLWDAEGVFQIVKAAIEVREW